jgi:phosphonoacetate hydrolase
MSNKNQITVNGKNYNWPKKTTIIICLDGSEPGPKGYIDTAIEMGLMPFMKSMISNSTYEIGKCAMPSFTNVNNMSIVTGTTPDVHGICGNFFFDPELGKETLMNDDSFLRAPTIFEAFENAGAKIAVITAKDKLRKLLGKNLTKAICFSSEKADQVNMKDNRIENVLELTKKPLPDVYSSDLSEFIFAAAVEIVKKEKLDLIYLSTTDFIQHKCAPGSKMANDFYHMIDGYLQKLYDLGCEICFTADHGMKGKTNADGSLNLIYLQDELDNKFGKDICNVICTITDPYVVHHGSFGSFVTIYLKDKNIIKEAVDYIKSIEGIDLVLTNSESVTQLNQPSDRIGDLVVTSNEKFAIGKKKTDHDLTKLKEPLRTHGGMGETDIPIFLSKKIDQGYKSKGTLRNFDIFDLALNYG